MSQITKGIRSILSHPFIYSSFQFIMGGTGKSRKNFVAEKIQPFAGVKILDIGCGPADILHYLPDIEYWGFDISEEYILYARKKYGTRGNFQCKEMQLSDLSNLPSFDVVLALGVLHHLDDVTATSVLSLAAMALNENGRLITVDPCFAPFQNPIARFLIRNDRGRNVRNRDGYNELAVNAFTAVNIEVRHKAWIPYTHCFMECRK